jgi:hypothetical protein
MAAALSLLDDGLDALCALDVDAMTDAELHELTVATHRFRDRLTAATATIVARWDARRVWADDQSKAPGARLARETGSAKRSTDEVLRRARALATMPATRAAARAGTLSIDMVDLLVGANTPGRRDVFAADEEFLIRQFSTLRYAEAAKAIRYWCHQADAALGIDDTSAEDQSDAAHLHVSPTLDDLVVVNGVLDPVGGAIVTGELDRLLNDLRERDRDAGIERTLPQLRAAALAEMARRSAAMPEGARLPRPLFTVLLGDRSFATMCELANGTVITPKRLVPFMTDAMLETILFSGPTTVVSVSKRRTFVGAIRRAIEVRDRHCQHPAGCDVPADQCDVDHIVPHIDGGPTSQGNGRLECRVHNRNAAKHDHGATPLPDQPLDRLDEIRARLRWKLLRELDGADDDDNGDSSLADTG